jgi:hypothetical protein
MKALSVFVACAMMIIPPLSSQTWKGTSEKQGDIVVVKNPKTPLFSLSGVRFIEELSIGGGTLSPEAALGGIRDVAVAADGSVFIADYKQGKILAFGPDGQYLFSFGKRGQGPGEFSSPNQVSVRNERREIFVDGSRKGVVFNREGRFKENTTYPFDLLMVRSDERGSLVGMVMDNTQPKGIYQLVKTGGDGGKPLILATAPLIDLNSPDPFMPRLAWDLCPDGSIAEGLPEKYEIRIHDATGKILRIVSREYDPVPVTAKDEEAYLKTIPPGVMAETGKPRFSKRHSAFQRIIADERGWLFVQTHERTRDGKSFLTDIFDADGRYVAQFGEGGTVFRARGGKMYVVSEDEEGFPIVKRYNLEGSK